MPVLRAEYVNMSVDDLIKEHKRLLEVLHNANPEELQAMYVEQEKELAGYLKERQPYVSGDIVKVMSGSNAHLGKTGTIGRTFNNGTEDYYEVVFNDGFDLLFKENMKKIRGANFNFTTNLIAEAPQDALLSPGVKAKETDELAEYFSTIREKLLNQLEREV
jgi:restriction endonuclease S subunit